VKIYSEFW